MATETTAPSTSRGTVGADIVSAPALSETRLQAHLLTEDIGAGRQEARDHLEKYDNLHKRGHDVEWRTRSLERARLGVTALLSELADLGFAWKDIARMVGVSVPAVQKWRRGEKASGDSRAGLASLLSACDLIAEHYMVSEIASWFEMPIVRGAPVTAIDLYAADRADLVFALASGHEDPEALLSEFDPQWRERYSSNFEVFRAGDERLSIRVKQ